VLWQDACDQGEERACAYLGMVELDRKGAEDVRQRLRGICDSTHHAGCAGLGLLLEGGLGGPRDFRGALGAYLSGCDAGEPSACVFAGVLIEENSDDPAHRRRALELYELGCQAPTSELCWVDEVKPDGPFRAHFVGESFERRACDGAEARALACYNAALSYERGGSGLVDGQRAQLRLDDSCAQGFERACRAAQAYEVH
jgi:TPR repeat protein